MNSIVNKMTDKIKDEMVTRSNRLMMEGISNIKNQFGKSFYFSADNETTLMNEIIDKFLKKYDKKFESHTSDYNRKPYYINKELLIPLENNDVVNIPDTFILLRTGTAIIDNEMGNIKTSINFRDMQSPVDFNNMYLFIRSLLSISRN